MSDLITLVRFVRLASWAINSRMTMTLLIQFPPVLRKELNVLDKRSMRCRGACGSGSGGGGGVCVCVPEQCCLFGTMHHTSSRVRLVRCRLLACWL